MGYSKSMDKERYYMNKETPLTKAATRTRLSIKKPSAPVVTSSIAKTDAIIFRITPAHKKEIQQAAKRANISVSLWLLRAASEKLTRERYKL